MENKKDLCKDCKNCSIFSDPEPLVVKIGFSNNETAEWRGLVGAKCALLDMWISDVVSCEKFESK